MELLLLPLIGISIGIAILIGFQKRQATTQRSRDTQQAYESQLSLLTTTQCPQCAEDIKVQAKICRHCGTDVTEHNQKARVDKAPKLNQLKRDQVEWWVESDRKYRSLSRQQVMLWESVGSPDLTEWDESSDSFEEWLKKSINPSL